MSGSDSDDSDHIRSTNANSFTGGGTNDYDDNNNNNKTNIELKVLNKSNNENNNKRDEQMDEDEDVEDNFEDSLSEYSDNSDEPSMTMEEWKDKILYDLLKCVDVNVQTREGTDYKPWSSDKDKFVDFLQRSYQNVLAAIRNPFWSLGICYYDTQYRSHLNMHNWYIKLSNRGDMLAVLKERTLEFRSVSDNFTSVKVISVIKPTDDHPSWRRICWSPDDSLVALVSAGYLFIIDRLVFICWYSAFIIPLSNNRINITLTHCLN